MRTLLALLCLLFACPAFGQGPIREVRYEFRHLAGTMPYAENPFVHNKVYFHSVTQEKLIAFFKAHPKAGVASQSESYVNKLSEDPMAEYVEKYLAKVDAGEGIDYPTSDAKGRSRWGYSGGVLYRNFYIYLSPTEKGWVRIEIRSHSTADVPVGEPKHPGE